MATVVAASTTITIATTNNTVLDVLLSCIQKSGFELEIHH